MCFCGCLLWFYSNEGGIVNGILLFHLDCIYPEALLWFALLNCPICVLDLVCTCLFPVAGWFGGLWCVGMCGCDVGWIGFTWWLLRVCFEGLMTGVILFEGVRLVWSLGFRIDFYYLA